MLRSLRLVLVLSLVAVCSLAAVQMGWNEYTFRKTKVTVLMPSSAELEESVQDDDVGKTYTVSATVDGVIFLAVSKKVKKSDAAGLSEAAFRTEVYNGLESTFRNDSNYEITATREIELNGVPGRELDFIRGGNQYGFMRILYKDLRAVTLMMMKQGEYPNNFHADVYFASVKFLD